ncbi:MAG: ABC-2 transporter permease [Candidatus Aminicenantes bacterium]|nr:ABC-2 transporter permease [Candidatus Aminicenantes bacterium]
MRYLIRKFSFFFVSFLLIALGGIFPLMNYDRLTAPDPGSIHFALTLMPFIFWVVIGATWSHEQWEDRYNGYALLSILPVDAGDIVRAKFTVVFLSTLFYVLSAGIVFFLVSKNPGYWKPSIRFMVVNANICLVLAALSYVGIFRFGYAKFGKFILIFWFLLLIAPIPINQLLLPWLGISRLDAIRQISNLNWIVATIIGIGIYLALMQVAIKIYKTARS